MAGIRFADLHMDIIRPGVERRMAYTDHLMMTIWDFHDGPQEIPDPPHSHLHEQITYIVAGTIYFFMDGEPKQMNVGDVITVPSGIPHNIQRLTDYVRLVDCFTPLREDFLPKE